MGEPFPFTGRAFPLASIPLSLLDPLALAETLLCSPMRENPASMNVISRTFHFVEGLQFFPCDIQFLMYIFGGGIHASS